MFTIWQMWVLYFLFVTQIKQFNQNRIIIYTNSRIINYSKIYIKKIIDQQLTFNIHLISLRIDTREYQDLEFFPDQLQMFIESTMIQ